MSDRIAEIRERLEGATPGPWQAISSGREHGDHWYVTDAGEAIASIHASDGEDEDQREPDAEFIAHAPDDIAYLLARLSAVTDALDREKLEPVIENGWCAGENEATIASETGYSVFESGPLYPAIPVRRAADAVRRHVLGEEQN